MMEPDSSKLALSINSELDYDAYGDEKEDEEDQAGLELQKQDSETREAAI